MKLSHSNKREQALTLLEVAVVVAVLFVVALMMLVVMMMGTKKRTKIKCVNNLKQIGLSYKIFAADNNDLFPHQVPTNVAYQDQSRAWIHFQGMSNELQTAKVLVCPQDKARIPNMASDFLFGKNATSNSLPVRGNEAVSYFVSLGATLETPMAILSGERSMAPTNNARPYSTLALKGAVPVAMNSDWSLVPPDNIHDGHGNLLRSDGSVSQASAAILQNQLRLTLEQHGSNAIRFVFPQ